MNRTPHAPPHTIIRASAGTGKTFQLSNRFLDLLLADTPPERILASTFTRKAAGEILNRVLNRLAGAAVDEDQRRQLDEFLAAGGALTRERCLRLLTHLARNLHQMRVGTLDSFFAQIARSFSLELGLSPRWTIVEQLEDERLRDEAVEEVLRNSGREDILRILYLITKGEAKRGVADLIRDTVRDMYGLFQETDREAWHALPRKAPLADDEVREVLDELRGVAMSDKRMDGARSKDIAQAADGEWVEFLDGGLTSKVVDESCQYYRKDIPAEAVALYRRLIVHAQALQLAAIANQNEGTYELLARFDVEYQRLKLERRALRFDDVTRRLAQSTTAGFGRLAFRLDAAIDHLLLDEFQDTSPEQWQVVRPFAKHVTETGAPRSFFCVGDLKQAIYGWRGGVAEIFDAVESQLEGLTPESLTRSFRSAQPVIDVVNRVFTRIENHNNLERLEPAVRQWCADFELHETARTEKAGYVRLESADDEKQVLKFAAGRVKELVETAPGRGVGVLVRSNDAVAKMIFHLRALGVQASEEGGNPLTDSVAVLLALSALRLADHPGDTAARFHLCGTALADEIGLSSWREDAAAARASQSIRRSLADEGYGRTLYRWARRLAPDCSRRELNRLEQLVRLGYGYDASATLRADDFRAYVKNQRVADPVAADVRVMTVHQSKGLQFDIVVLPELDKNFLGQTDMFVVNRPDPTSPPDRVCRHVNSAVRPLLPPSFQTMFDDAVLRDAKEALCVLYVALTRAVHALHLVVAPHTAKGKTPKSYAGLLRAALSERKDAPPETTLYEHGDPHWYTHADGVETVEARVESAGDAEAFEPLQVQLAATPSRRTRGLPRTSPSSLEGGGRVDLAELLRRERSAALERGTVIHAWFEQIDWLDDGDPPDSLLQTVAAEVLESNLDIAAALSDFRRMLAEPEIAAWLRLGAYDEPARVGFPTALCRQLTSAAFTLQVYNERRFAIRDGEQLLSGAIDRLVVLLQNDRVVAADILDFKTDALADASEALAHKVAHYAPQVAAYRRAVSQMFNLPPKHITARLLFVGKGRACEVPPS
ncbi:MAG: UvrD-helicase domain-containing protein [Pirellulaceae bacterium]